MHNKIQQYKKNCELLLTVQTTFNHSLNSNKNTIFYGSCADYKRGKIITIYMIFILGSFLWHAVLKTPHRGRRLCTLKGISGVSQTLQLLPLALLNIVCTHHMIISYNMTLKIYQRDNFMTFTPHEPLTEAKPQLGLALLLVRTGHRD